jgi:hypothetical protein
VHHEQLQDITATRGEHRVQTSARKVGARNIARPQRTRVGVCGAEDVKPAACAQDLRKLIQHHAGGDPPQVDRYRPIEQQPNSLLCGVKERLDLVDHDVASLRPGSGTISATAGLALIDIIAYPAVAHLASALSTQRRLPVQ